MAVHLTGARVSGRSGIAARFGAILALVALVALVSACATGGARKPPTGTPDPDKFLFDRGTEALNNHRWVVAREYFRQLVDSYPQSPYRADAKVGIGDTYLNEGTAESYVLAINEYREFLSFYPTSPRADYAQYNLAMAHFKQMRAAARDQTETRDAVREFETFLQKYPNSPLAKDARQHKREAQDRLGDHEYEVGLLYFKMRWYPGAVNRLEPLLKSDPQYSNRDAAYYYLGESLIKLNRNAEALPYFERLVKEFEQSAYLQRAHEAITELKDKPKDTGKGDKAK